MHSYIGGSILVQYWFNWFNRSGSIPWINTLPYKGRGIVLIQWGCIDPCLGQLIHLPKERERKVTASEKM